MQNFASKLLAWFKENQRELPWRNQQNPYKIWLSEIILQQTRVQQGLPYYERFVENFPTIQDLAKADEQTVLRLWQGLGYYSRARNMHFAAKQVMEDFSGEFPTTFSEILQLKGVGIYTASAIASFAFGEKVAVVDGNVYRVLSRVFGIETDISSGKGQKEFQLLADECLPPKSKVADYNQAIMEFGAMHCKPANPECETCTFANLCEAKASKRQSVLPFKAKKLKIRKRYFQYLVFEFENQLFLKERTEKGIWQGLHDFALLETEKQVSETDVLSELQELGISDFLLKDVLQMKVHKLSHQHLHTQFFHLQLKEKKEAEKIKKQFSVTAFSKEAIQELPKPILIVNYLERQEDC